MQDIAWQAMGLTQDPFPDGGADGIFLQTPALGQRLSLFTQLAQASDLTLLLIGEHGIGKTTFLDRISQLLEDGWRIVSVEATADTTFADVCAQMRAGLTLDPAEQADEDMSLDALTDTLAASGYRALLIVDDADRVADAELVQLLELGRRLRVALAGATALADRVAAAGEQMPSSDAGLVHRIVLGELNLPQTTDYLRTRLSRCGHDGTTPFTADVCDQIFKGSRGVPGVINALASEFLETEPLARDGDESIELDPPTRDTASVKAKLTTHAPIQPRISLHSEPHRRALRQAAPLAALTVLIVALIAAAYGVFAWWTKPPTDVVESPDQQATPAAQPDTDDRYPELPEAPPPPPPTVLADTSQPLVDTLTTSDADSTDTVAPVVASDALPATPAQTTRDAAAALNLPPLTESTPAANSAAPDSGIRPRPRRAPRERRDDTAEVAAAPAAVEARPPPSPPAASTGGSTWLERGNDDRFTVQLIALTSVSAAREYIKRNQLDAALIVSLKTPDAKPLFAIVQGVYDRREQALDAIRRMPAPVRQEAPWPRHVGTLLEAAHSVRTP